MACPRAMCIWFLETGTREHRLAACIPGGLHSHPMERQVSIRLPARLLEEIDRRAKRRRCPRAGVIRAALAAYIELPDGALEARPADRVRDLMGSAEGLPADLATNADRYLADLGRRR
ncbi:MAG: ribbon-helix-helix protein, CopG family [Planctomycetes bacterium]|nr:ribbon-helix-helix protein, CopG family [Planctomycetota bacterium]